MSTPDDDALTWAGDPDRDTTNITWSAPKARKASTSRSSSGGVAAVSRREKDGFDTPTASATQPATPDTASTTEPGFSRPRSGRIETPGKARSSSGGVAAVSRREKDGFDTPTASATQPATASGNVDLIVTAAFAAVYLLVTVAWLIVALRNPLTIADPLGNAMFTLGLWAAVLAGPLVSGGVIVLGKHLSLAKRLVLFALGIVVLIPWPYLEWAS